MTAGFVKLFMGDNAMLLTDYSSITGYHTLKVSGLVVGPATNRLLAADGISLLLAANGVDHIKKASG